VSSRMNQSHSKSLDNGRQRGDAYMEEEELGSAPQCQGRGCQPVSRSGTSLLSTAAAKLGLNFFGSNSNTLNSRLMAGQTIRFGGSKSDESLCRSTSGCQRMGAGQSKPAAKSSSVHFPYAQGHFQGQPMHYEYQGIQNQGYDVDEDDASSSDSESIDVLAPHWRTNVQNSTQGPHCYQQRPSLHVPQQLMDSVSFPAPNSPKAQTQAYYPYKFPPHDPGTPTKPQARPETPTTPLSLRQAQGQYGTPPQHLAHVLQQQAGELSFARRLSGPRGQNVDENRNADGQGYDRCNGNLSDSRRQEQAEAFCAMIAGSSDNLVPKELRT
jgi:hypothetical protein